MAFRPPSCVAHPHESVHVAQEVRDEILFATDIGDYADWTLAHILRQPEFRFAPERPGIWHEP